MQATNAASSLLLISALLCPGAHAQDLEARTDAIFAEWDRDDAPGCAVAVIRNGEVAYSNGFGLADLEHDVPITPKTVFYIGSTSKQFVTVCVALLEEAGVLGYDDPVRKHIPEFPEYEEPVTIRQLIHHTSGVRDYLELWHLAGRDYLDYMPEQAVLDMICRQEELNFAPGSRNLYSNSCYFLLSVLVERVSGMTLREYAQQHVFGPLGMNSSRFHDDHEELIPNRAFSYEPRSGGSYNNLISRFDLVGSGGVYSTVEDLAHWDRNFYGNELGKGGPALLETMHTRGVLDSGRELSYAHALIHGTYRGAKTVSHGGALAGYRAELIRFPEHSFTVAILCNLGTMNPTLLAERVADAWLGDELPQPADPGVAEAASSGREVAAVDPAILARYAGNFDLGERKVEVVVDGDRVIMTTDEGETIRLWPESETAFFVKEVPMSVVFGVDDQGVSDTLVVTLRGQDIPGTRMETPPADLDHLAMFAGDYFSGELEVTYRLRVEEGELTVAVGYRPAYAISHRDGATWEGGGAEFVFERDDAGAVTGFRVSTGRVKDLRFAKR